MFGRRVWWMFCKGLVGLMGGGWSFWAVEGFVLEFFSLRLGLRVQGLGIEGACSGSLLEGAGDLVSRL